MASTSAVERPQRVGWAEPLAIVALLVGGVVVPFAGWLAGVTLLWRSPAWSLRDKVVGTVVLPGGLLAFAVYGVLGVRADCPPGPTVLPSGGQAVTLSGTCPEPGLLGALAAPALGAVLLVAPIATAVYLAARLRRGLQ